MPPIRLNTRLNFREREYRVYTAWDGVEGLTRSDVFGGGQRLYSRVAQANGSPGNGEPAFDGVKTLHTRVAGDLDHLFQLSGTAEAAGESGLHNYVGELFAGRSMWVEAKSEFERALELDDDNASALFNVGRVYSALGLHHEAIERFRRALRTRSDYPDYQNALGEALLADGRCREAAAGFRAAARLNPYYWLPFYNLGLAYLTNHLRREDYRMSLDFQTKAIESFERARALCPEIGGAEYDAGVSRLRDDAPDDALSILLALKSTLVANESPIEVSPFEVWRRSPSHQPGERELAQAIGDLRRRCNEHPDWADLHCALAQAYSHLARTVFGKAVDQWRRALAINPGFIQAQRNLRLSENELKGLDLLVQATLEHGNPSHRVRDRDAEADETMGQSHGQTTG